MAAPVQAVAVTGEAPYQVLVGRDLLARLDGLLPGARRVALLHTEPVATHAARVAAKLRAGGVEVVELAVPDAEAGKRVEVAARCWDELGRAGLTRTDAIVGVGGGALTDLAGFVAACWLRGVRWVPVPTSLLGMVDASIGGKTAVNLDAGKNLVGAFHPPAGVLCDLSTLDTQAAPDLVSGLAEVIKCGFIADPKILDLVEADPVAAASPHSPVLAELVARSVSVKANVVSADLREQGPREILNYGHTLGHAIEACAHFHARHGEAVAVGMVYAAALAARLGMLDQATAVRHGEVLAAVGLPVRAPAGAWPSLYRAMRLDKKSRAGGLRLVLLSGLARPEVVAAPDEDMLARVYQEVS